MPTAELNGRSLNYVLEGPPDADVLVLSNSLGTDLSSWDAVASVLSRKLRVLRYDTRGHGASSTPAGDWSIADLGRDVLDLLDQLGLDSVSFCGLSVGGMTGMWLATHAPERIDRLVLCCTSAFVPPADAWAERAHVVRHDGMSAIEERVIARWFTPEFWVEQPRDGARLRSALLNSEPEGYAKVCEAIGAMDQRESVARIQAPTLVIAGALDEATPPSHAELLVDAIPDATLSIVSQAAHLAPMERPDAVTALLQTHLGLRLPGDSHDRGMARRRAVLGSSYVQRATSGAGPLAGDFQELITRFAWGEVWSRPGLDTRTRRLLTIGMLVALRSWEEFSLHTRAALEGDVTAEEVADVLIHASVYAGVPAANHAFTCLRRLVDDAEET